jgi:hypothetical protein
MAQHMAGSVFGGPEPTIEAEESPSNEPTMRAGLQNVTKPPAPPTHWDATTGSAPATQIHHAGKLHNQRTSMTVEMPPAGGTEKEIKVDPPRERVDQT